MRLRSIRYFLTLAETKHYTKAAEKLGVSQPSISHAIRELEKELGLPLFHPERRTELTEWGEQFVAAARSALSILDEGSSRIQREAEGIGTIRIGLMRTLGTKTIPELAAAYRSAHGECRLTFTSGRTGELLDALTEGRTDIAFVSDVPSSGKFVPHYLFSMKLALAVPKGHPLAERESVTLEDTLPYPLIHYSKGTGMRKIVEDAYHSIGRMPEEAYEDEEVLVLAGLAAAGFGIAIVPAVKLLESLDTPIIPIKPEVEMPIYAALSADRIASPASLDFLRYTIEKLGRKPDF